jgi:hypothetical protein
MPKTFKVGDTADCRINKQPARLTWRDAKTLVIEPDDARAIITTNYEDDFIKFICRDARESGCGAKVHVEDAGYVVSAGGNDRSGASPRYGNPVVRADRFKHAVAKENEAWDRATERRADAEYALEQFEESVNEEGRVWHDLSEEEFEEKCEWMREAIRKAKEEEAAARQLARSVGARGGGDPKMIKETA